MIYIATARPDPQDPEWQERIRQHQQRRPATWQTWEVPTRLGETLAQTAADADHFLIIDALGTWTANLIEQDDRTWQASSAQFLSSLQKHRSTIAIVAEETGWGVVPPYPLGRRFRDRLGRLTQQTANLADAVYVMIAGHALPLHQLAEKLPTP